MELSKIILRKNLKELRDLKGWNQDDLAEASGYTRGFIADIERGKSWVSPEALEALSKALDVSLERLFVSGEKPRPISLPVSEVVKKFLNIPDDVYELAANVRIDDSAWDTVRSALEIAIERPVKQSKHSSQA